MIELIIHSIGIGLLAFMFCSYFIEDGNIFGRVERFYSDKEPETFNVIQYFIYKMLTCNVCQSGQIALILYLTHFETFCVYNLLLTIGLASFSSWFLANKN